MRSRYPEVADPRLLSYFVGGGSVDATLIRYDMGLDADDFRAAIGVLKNFGCEFEKTDVHSYRLTRSSLNVWQEYLEYIIRIESLMPTSVRVYQETSSTQDQAKRLAPQRALVIADQQSAGRGRLSRQWVSAPESSVLMSFSLPLTVTSHDRVSMLVGVAVAKAVESLLPDIAVRLKWPNDVMIDGSKLSGILIEIAQGAFIIGIGLNVTQESVTVPALIGLATCLRDHGCNADRLRVIEQVLIEVDRALRLADNNLMLEEWRARASLGQTQTFEQAGQRITGEVMDLDPDHGLIVRRDTGEIVTLPAATTSVVK